MFMSFVCAHHWWIIVWYSLMFFMQTDPSLSYFYHPMSYMYFYDKIYSGTLDLKSKPTTTHVPMICQKFNFFVCSLFISDISLCCLNVSWQSFSWVLVQNPLQIPLETYTYCHLSSKWSDQCDLVSLLFAWPNLTWHILLEGLIQAFRRCNRLTNIM